VIKWNGRYRREGRWNLSAERCAEKSSSSDMIPKRKIQDVLQCGFVHVFMYISIAAQ
jgi:hypothetical protein